MCCDHHGLVKDEGTLKVRKSYQGWELTDNRPDLSNLSVSRFQIRARIFKNMNQKAITYVRFFFFLQMTRMLGSSGLWSNTAEG
jgi:hypothetical protein